MNFSKLRHALFFGILGLITIVFLYMIRPFAYPIFWAAIIAGIFYPLHKRLTRLVKNKNFSAILTLIVVFFLIVIPLLSIGTLLVSESLDVYASVENNRSQIGSSLVKFADKIQKNPLATRLNIDEKFWVDKFAETTKTVTSYIFITLKNLTQNSLTFMAMFIFMFYALFFFLRDGKKILTFLMHLCPLGDKYEKILYYKFTSTARATLKGTIIVGSIQGILGGLLFYVTGVEAAFIWAIIMAALSVIPPLSSAIIWLPAGIIMLVTGNIWEGILILSFGALVISSIDNLLRPILVGRDAEMHPLLVLFSTLGGLVMFGVSGFIIGPIIASLFMAFWEMYDHYYQEELCNNKE
ncbi:AI-2E family transporter [Patescibacteria group bacterium]|nr:AI-2E family transporter [Patescibacteria group bacterium]MBU1613225.1 AI-2E family transporter [Patescibacteria group bacterium]